VNNLSIFSAPFFALTRIDFYRRAAESRLVKGIQYLLYLSILSALIAVYVFVTVGLPKVQEIVDWVKAEMPVITVTQEGLSIDTPSPYVMIHPAFGPMVRFDMGKAEVTREDLADAGVFVTKKRVYVKQGNEIRIYDVVDYFSRNERIPVGGANRVTPDSVQEFFDGAKAWFTVIFFLLFLPFFFIWKLIVAVFYSWFGLLMNMGRRDKLTYGQILNVSIFAMTASILLQWLRLLVPVINALPVIDLVGIGLSFVYLALAIHKTDQAPAPV
jgi:hypothetical protein